MMIRIFAASLATAIAATMTTMASGNVAMAKDLCPHFVTDYCVVNQVGFRFTTQTNPCYASEEHWRVLHIGACEGPVCSDIVAPVCSFDYATGKRKTYSNQCLSDLASARVLHKGACKHPS